MARRSEIIGRFLGVVLGLALVLALPALELYEESREWKNAYDGERNREIFIDKSNRVLVVAPMERLGPNASAGLWRLDRPSGDRLTIHRVNDESSKQIEFRRDCVIFLDDRGTPHYVSLPLELFRVASSSGASGRYIEIVRELESSDSSAHATTTP